jgi:hypothetical protein
MIDNPQQPQPESQLVQLPRTGWDNQITYLKILLQTKQSLVMTEERWGDRKKNH